MKVYIARYDANHFALWAEGRHLLALCAREQDCRDWLAHLQGQGCDFVLVEDGSVR